MTKVVIIFYKEGQIHKPPNYIHTFRIVHVC